MKKLLFQVVLNRNGSVINVALLILILIFLVGIGLSKISTTDVKIASNLKTKTTTFYEAETGLKDAGEMIEQNMLCPPYGFKDTPPAIDLLNPKEEIIDNYFHFNNVEFARKNLRQEAFIPSIDGSDADFYYPEGDYVADPEAPHTTIKIGGVARYATGSAIQMAAGYEGLGKGAANKGFSYLFDVYARRIGSNNSTALHYMQWIYLPSAGECNYK